MKIHPAGWAVVLLALLNIPAPAATLYVNLTSTNPVPPYASWNTAATDIQDAVDASTNGDLILVGNGTTNQALYQTGGRVVGNSLMNRVAIDKPVTVESANGPSVTIITGVSTFSTSSSPVRGVYMTNGAALIGFLIMGGGTLRTPTDITNDGTGGGIWCESSGAVISNCIIAGSTASVNGSGTYGGTFYNCTLITNSVGGGPAQSAAFNSTLYNCSIISNYLGGVGSCWLSNCTLIGNAGGGANNSTLINCLIFSNSFQVPGGNAGGVYLCTLTNCVLAGNSANNIGGAVLGGTLVNCTLVGNSANAGGAVAATSSPSRPVLLNNCTISNNTAYAGGGVYNSGPLTNCVLINCTIVSNTASTGGGGGVAGGTINNCILIGNSTTGPGGGACGISTPTTLINCTICGNHSLNGAGTSGCVVLNCIDYYNFGTDNTSGPLRYSCTPVAGGVGCITNPPAFVNLAGGDFHLQSNSPCINSGNNAYVTSATDLDGNPRIVGGTVDIGAYEYQTPTSIISYAWLQQYGLPTDGSVDHADLDGTSFNVYQDWIAGLNPTNALSVLAMLQPVPTNNPPGLFLSWQSVSNRTYFLQSSANLAGQPAFSTVQSNIVGQAGIMGYTDTNAVGNGPYFYRVGVQQ